MAESYDDMQIVDAEIRRLDDDAARGHVDDNAEVLVRLSNGEVVKAFTFNDDGTLQPSEFTGCTLSFLRDVKSQMDLSDLMNGDYREKRFPLRGEPPPPPLTLRCRDRAEAPSETETRTATARFARSPARALVPQHAMRRSHLQRAH